MVGVSGLYIWTFFETLRIDDDSHRVVGVPELAFVPKCGLVIHVSDLQCPKLQAWKEWWGLAEMYIARSGVGLRVWTE